MQHLMIQFGQQKLGNLVEANICKICHQIILYCNWITYLYNSVPTHNLVLKLKTYKTLFLSFTHKQSYILLSK